VIEKTGCVYNSVGLDIVSSYTDYNDLGNDLEMDLWRIGDQAR